MAGFSFARIEVFARKSRSDSRSNRTASEVLDEAERVSGNMPHVSNPLPPKVVDGCSFEELRASHDAVNEATQTQKNGRTRKIRSTQNTLATAVLSYPVSCLDLKNGPPEDREKYFAWRDDAIQFMKQEWGSDYKCAVQHLDEKFPHLHLYAVRPDFDAKMNHPGYRAQAEAKASGASPKEAEIAGAMALKGFLDRYQEAVADKYGMNRFGPRRSRMSRKEWVKRQIANDEHAKVLRNRAQYKQDIKEEVAAEWAKTSLVGKASFARSTATDADVKKRSKEEAKRAVSSYINQFDNAEKAVKKAVASADKAKEKAASLEKKNDAITVLNTNLSASLDDANRHVAIVDYTLSENIKALHRKARLTNSENDYVTLSGACENVANIRKSVGPGIFKNAWHDVKQVVADVSKRVPAIFKKTFGWAITKQPEKQAAPPPRKAEVIQFNR